MTRGTFAPIGYFVLRPLFSWRGRILSRYFCQRPRFYDDRIRAAIEAVVDVWEMWLHKPGLDRMQKMADEAAQFAEELQAMRQKFGLDKGSQAPGEE